MAETYIVSIRNAALASLKSMFVLFNAVDSGVTISVHRVWIFNGYIGAPITGYPIIFQYSRISAFTSGTSIKSNVVPYDMNNAAIAAGVSIDTNSSVVGRNGTIKRTILTADEVSIISNTMDEWFTFPAIALAWDPGYKDTNVQPFVLRAGDEGFEIQVRGSTGYSGGVDIFVEFTQE